MSNKKFLGLRVEPQVYKIVNKVATEENVDKTKAVKLLVIAGWKERRLEIAFERDRFFDLVRTGQAKAAVTIDGKNFTEGKNELFPLPASFLREAGTLSSQNPGYPN